MTSLQERGRLEVEVGELDLPTLKKRRANLCRSGNRCDTFLREHGLRAVKDQDLKMITTHGVKLQQDIAMSDVIHDAIMDRLKEEEEEAEESDYMVQSSKMIATYTALEELAESARLYG